MYEVHAEPDEHPDGARLASGRAKEVLQSLIDNDARVVVFDEDDAQRGKKLVDYLKSHLGFKYVYYTNSKLGMIGLYENEPDLEKVYNYPNRSDGSDRGSLWFRGGPFCSWRR